MGSKRTGAHPVWTSQPVCLLQGFDTKLHRRFATAQLAGKLSLRAILAAAQRRTLHVFEGFISIESSLIPSQVRKGYTHTCRRYSCLVVSPWGASQCHVLAAWSAPHLENSAFTACFAASSLATASVHPLWLCESTRAWQVIMVVRSSV